MTSPPHYRIVSVMTEHALLTLVNNMIADGWIPTGGMSQKGTYYTQTMWKPPTIPELDKKIKAAMDSDNLM